MDGDQVARKVVNSYSFAEIAELIIRLPRGWAYFVSENVGRVVRIHAFEKGWRAGISDVPCDKPLGIQRITAYMEE